MKSGVLFGLDYVGFGPLRTQNSNAKSKCLWCLEHPQGVCPIYGHQKQLLKHQLVLEKNYRVNLQVSASSGHLQTNLKIESFLLGYPSYLPKFKKCYQSDFVCRAVLVMALGVSLKKTCGRGILYALGTSLEKTCHKVHY